MKLIGHRGAASITAENTIASILAAKKAGVDAIEFDIRLTKDHQFVLVHDADLERTHNIDQKVSNLSLDEISKIVSLSGHKIPSLEQALKACGDTPAVIEAKGNHWASYLHDAIGDHPAKHISSVISFNHHELHAFAKYQTGIPTYVLEHRNSFDAINAARVYKFNGIDINFWSLNPLTYFLAKRHNLRIIVFTVDKPWIARMLKFLYPEVDITTNVPQKMQHLRS
jgi:glycerophosphoryl diester phosphodiesterase